MTEHPTRRQSLPIKWRCNWKLAVMAGVLVSASACSDAADPGPSWAGFTRSFHMPSITTAVVVVVVDDRATPEASGLRDGMGAAVGTLGAAIMQNPYSMLPDRAPWHPVDVRVVLVPASSPAIEAVVSPANEPALAWTTNQPTQEGHALLGRSVQALVAGMTAPPGASFRPLERAAFIVRLLRGTRAPASDAEKRLVAGTFARRRPSSFVGLAIVAATDDESPDPVASYSIDDPSFDVPINVVTPEGRGLELPNATRYPRFAAWAKSNQSGWGCFDDEAARPFALFKRGLCTGRGVPRCDLRPIAEISPGLGVCRVEITTVDPSHCDAGRGWVDPMEVDGVRRPRVDVRGARVCEALPVESSAMAACMHDETCADCGSGWCLSDIQPGLSKACPDAPRVGLRWVGGVLPAPGFVRMTCLQADDSR